MFDAEAFGLRQESYFDEMATLGEMPGKLAEHFRELRRKYDIESILSILREIPTNGEKPIWMTRKRT